MSLLPWNTSAESLNWTLPSGSQWLDMLGQAWSDWALQAALAYVVIQRVSIALFADGTLYARHKAFWKSFMFAHNALLAVYSFATFVWSLWSLSQGARGVTGIANILFARNDHTMVW
jgi:hypothetical protein